MKVGLTEVREDSREKMQYEKCAETKEMDDWQCAMLYSVQKQVAAAGKSHHTLEMKKATDDMKIFCIKAIKYLLMYD